MGRSLHNKIYLGRRTALFNVRRLRTAIGIASVSAALVAWMVTAFR